MAPSKCDIADHPVKCPNGLCAKNRNECKEEIDCPSEFVRCSDGTCRKKLAYCPEEQCPVNLPIKCKNGLCVSDEKYCDRDNGCPFNLPFKCPNDGACVKEEKDCMKCYCVSEKRGERPSEKRKGKHNEQKPRGVHRRHQAAAWRGVGRRDRQGKGGRAGRLRHKGAGPGRERPRKVQRDVREGNREARTRALRPHAFRCEGTPRLRRRRTQALRLSDNRETKNAASERARLFRRLRSGGEFEDTITIMP